MAGSVGSSSVASLEASLTEAVRSSLGLSPDERPAFIEGVARQTFADTNINSVAESINKQKHYVQRGTSAGAESFMRSG